MDYLNAIIRKPCQRTGCGASAEKIYVVDGPYTGFKQDELRLCDACATELAGLAPDVHPLSKHFITLKAGS